MSRVRVHSFVVSLDGFGAGEPQSLQEPFGHTGLPLHGWMTTSKGWRDEGFSDPQAHPDMNFNGTEGIGAVVMGRNMFSPDRGEWDESWRGWWGENPPYHNPTFVMTHYERDDLPMEGGTTFKFVSGTPAEVLELAREAAGGKDVQISGGATTTGSFLRAGLIDYAHFVVAPVIVGQGVRFWDGLDNLTDLYDVVEAVGKENVTHLRLLRKS